jgi:alanyl-tRNA synthetase
MRRAIREAHKLGNRDLFLDKVAEVVINKLWKTYPHMIENKKEILNTITEEEKQFSKTLENWLREFEKLVKWLEIAFERTGKKIDTIAWVKAFRLYDTYGFPIEMTIDLAKERWLKVDVEWFNKAFKEHQEKSRTASAGKFKWGLADHSEETTALHTATHLMLEWLNQVLGWWISQKGSNITPERLRFDFSFDRKLTKEELEKVEEYVNNAIQSWFVVEVEEMPKEQALKEWVRWAFWEKYPDIVKVYTIKWNDGTIYSRELCGWPHVKDSSKMWRFKIKKEEASSKWVRRIKAVLVKD